MKTYNKVDFYREMISDGYGVDKVYFISERMDRLIKCCGITLYGERNVKL